MQNLTAAQTEIRQLLAEAHRNINGQFVIEQAGLGNAAFQLLLDLDIVTVSDTGLTYLNEAGEQLRRMALLGM